MASKRVNWNEWGEQIRQWIMERLSDQQIADKISESVGFTVSKHNIYAYRKRHKIAANRRIGETVTRNYGRKPKPESTAELPIRYENGIPVIQCPTRHADTLLWGRWVR